MALGRANLGNLFAERVTWTEVIFDQSENLDLSTVEIAHFE